MTQDSPTTIKFKGSYAREQSFMLPISMLIPLLVVFSVVGLPYLFLVISGKNPNYIPFIGLAALLYGPFILLFSGKPWKKIGKMHSPQSTIVAQETRPTIAPGRIKPVFGPRVRKSGNRKQTVHPIEDKIHLAEIVRFYLEDDDIGAYLQETPSGDRTIVWAFDCEGISYSLSPDQYNDISEKLQAALGDYSRSGSGDTLTFDAEVRAGCSEQLTQVEKMKQGRPPEDVFILDGIKARTEDLTRAGRHAPRSLRIYCTTSLKDLAASIDDPDLGDQLVNWVEQKLPGVKDPSKTQAELKDQLSLAYEKSFKAWRRRIEKRLCLDVRPASWQEAWQWAWDEVNTGPAPALNRLLTLTEKGLSTKQNPDDQRALASILFQAGPPELSKTFVYLRGRGEYVSTSVMTAYPFREWHAKDRLEQLKYASAAINDKDAINTRVIVQFSTVPPGQAEFAANWRTKTENSQRLEIAKKERKDVASEEMFSEAVEAERSLKRGETVIKAAWVAMVSRPTHRALNDATASLIEHNAFSGKIVLREMGYCEEIWLAAMPALTSHKLLQRNPGGVSLFANFDRRLENESGPMVGLLPILKERPLHSEGVPLVSRLRSPLRLNPCQINPFGNMVIIGEKGSGKSGLIQALAKYAKMIGSRVFIIDGAPADCVGSFKSWADYEPDAAYFNPNRDASNIFDGVDRRFVTFNSSDENSFDAWGFFETFLCQALTDLTYSGQDPDTRKAFKQLHQAVAGAFFEDPEIQRLRNAAFDGGISSEAWLQMPTLHHYLGYMTKGIPDSVLQYIESDILARAQKALYSLLQQPLGKAIARPTSVDFDNASVIVYAMSAIASEEDMLPLSIAMQGNLNTQIAKPGLKTLVLEEAAVNLKYEINAALAEMYWAQGRKNDLHCILASQVIDPITQSRAGSSILGNSDIKIVGAIDTSSIDGVSELFKTPREFVAQCAQATFYPKPEEVCRNFLISIRGEHTFASYYADFRSLFMFMNEGRERSEKREMQALYHNKFQCIDEGAKRLRSRSIHGGAQ